MVKKVPAPLAGEPARLPIEHLRFDSTNPRIADLLGESPSQTQIQQLLLTGEMRARELVPSFMENGYIPYEPLIVRPEGDYYVVMEGNRRLAALRSMKASEDPDEVEAFKKYDLNKVPCLIFKGDERQLLAYLGLRHLSKTKDWSTSAKGAFVERVLANGFDVKAAAKLTNTSTSALRLILLTRRLFERAADLGAELPQAGATGETFFWHLGDAVRRTRTKQYLKIEEDPNPLKQPKIDETRFERLIGWLYGNTKTGQLKLIRSIRDIASLDELLGNDRSIAVLEGGGSLEEGKEELQAAGATIVGHLDRAKRSLERASGGPWTELDEVGLGQVRVASSQISAALENIDGLAKIRDEILKNPKKSQ